MKTVDADLHSPGLLSRADRLQPVLLLASIAVGLGLAASAPAVAGSLDVLVSVGVVALIFFAMLGLDIRGVADSLDQRRFLGLAIALNFVVNPLLAWGLGNVFLQEHPELRVGLILFLVTPCIGWYLIFTELSGGDVSLGVSLLGINLILQILLLPLYLLIIEGRALGVGIEGVIKSIVLFLVLPTLAAVATQHVLGRRSIDAVGRAHLKMAALAVVIVAMFASQGDVIFDNPGVVLRLLAPMLAFFAVAFALALAIGRGARLSYDQTALLAFTTTSRNSEASLAIAVTAFTSPLVALTVVIGPIIELPLLVLMVRALVGLRPSYPNPDPQVMAQASTQSTAQSTIRSRTTH